MLSVEPRTPLMHMRVPWYVFWHHGERASSRCSERSRYSPGVYDTTRFRPAL